MSLPWRPPPRSRAEPNTPLLKNSIGADGAHFVKHPNRETANQGLQVPDFSQLSVAVVGDLIADQDIVTEPRGLSREAPVMVLRHASEQIGAGGAGNVARNLRALGARTSVLGAVGRDARGRELLELLSEAQVEVSGVATVSGWTTPTKTRVFAAEPRRSRQQVLRIDREPAAPVEESLRRELAQRVRSLAGVVDAVVISDYEYGLVDDLLAEAVRELSSAGTICVLDPRRPLQGFGGLTAWTPNVGELARLVGVEVDELEEPGRLGELSRSLAASLAMRYLLVTRGNLGMALFGADLPEAGLSVEASGLGDVTDVSGAGDTAAAVFALALTAGRTAPDAMWLANAASGVVVMQSGAAVCTSSELAQALRTAPRPRVLDVGVASLPGVDRGDRDPSVAKGAGREAAGGSRPDEAKSL